MDETNERTEKRLEYPLPRETTVYLRRSMVSYQSFQERVKNRYWVCGTSLNALRENVLTDILANGVKDFKILFPDYRADTPSLKQLQAYRERPEQEYDDPIENIKRTHRHIEGMLQKRGYKVSDYLRLYQGIMFQNISVFDEDAFISFYDATGFGPDNITVYCTRAVNEALYKRIDWLFSDMWNVSE